MFAVFSFFSFPRVCGGMQRQGCLNTRRDVHTERERENTVRTGRGQRREKTKEKDEATRSRKSVMRDVCLTGNKERGRSGCNKYVR